MNDILAVVLRSATVYVCIVVFIRIFGKKELSQLSVIDLVFILLISNSVQNSMVGDNTSLSGGLIAAATLFALNTMLRLLVYKFRPLEKFLEGEAIMLVYKGKVIKKNLDLEKITLEELNASIREHGIRDIASVDLAILETDGNISVLSDDYTRRSSKKRRQHKALSKNE